MESPAAAETKKKLATFAQSEHFPEVYLVKKLKFLVKNEVFIGDEFSELRQSGDFLAV